MKILLVTKKFPYPLKEGEPIAINYLASSLARHGCTIDLLVLNTSKHFFDPKHLPSEANFYHQIHSVRVDNHITISGAAKSLLLGRSYILDRFFSKAFEAKLADLLQQNQYDVVQMETIYLAHYIKVVRQYFKGLLALRAHNVEHEIWERVAATSNPLKKWYLQQQNRFLKTFETGKLNDFGLLLAITGRDLAAFRQLGFRNTGLEVPVGINLADYPIHEKHLAPEKSVCFIGALDWMPNQHGLKWFIEQVWADLSPKFGSAMLHVAGKNTPDWVYQWKGPNTQIHGEVPDAKAFISQSSVMVAPLFSGSGIKIKVLEGMALGKTVVTTSIGAEGISARHGQHLLIADTAADFQKHLQWCFERPSEAAQIGLAARGFIQAHFDNTQIAQSVVMVYQKNLSS
jgi:glycosyltransferase involved in cell wall biosynthesis